MGFQVSLLVIPTGGGSLRPHKAYSSTRDDLPSLLTLRSSASPLQLGKLSPKSTLTFGHTHDAKARAQKPNVSPLQAVFHQIRHIHVGVAVGCSPFILGPALTHKMVRYAVRFLLHHGSRKRGVAQH